MQLDNLTIDYLRSRYRDGSLTPASLVEHLFEKSQQFASKNIWIQQLSLAQLFEYTDALTRENFDNKPLWGIPFVIKDNIDLAKIPTTAACEAFAYEPQESAFVVAQLINAGAIPLGKANLDQFATGLVGVRSPEKWGPCKNAFNDNYVSGGSSSGSAVSVALGLATFSLGTDTAGSGRIPAAFNNIIGLKPSRGLLSCSGVVPACRSLDCVTIFAASVDDAHSVFQVAAEFDLSDAYARKKSDRNLKNYGRVSAPFSFAVPQAEQLNFFGNKSAQHAFENAVSKMEALGGTKTIIDFSPFLEAAKLLYSGPWVAERYVATEKIFTDNPEAMLPVIKQIIGSQTSATAADAFKAFYTLQEYKQQADQIIQQFDFILTPTAGTIYTQADLHEKPIENNSNLGFYTNYMNLLDYSAIAVPAGFIETSLGDNMPFGITLVGKALDDNKLLSFANLWQSQCDYLIGATDWKMPSLSESTPATFDTVDIVVCGAHLDGLPLNWQLTERDAVFIEATRTSKNYRFYALAGGPPKRPGLIRDENNGEQIEVEIWRLPSNQFGSFVAGIPQPLGIGKVELEDGRWLSSFICEGYAIHSAQEITELKSWLKFLK